MTHNMSRLEWMRKAAKAAYGPEWPARLSAAIGVSSSLARAWRAGTRKPSQAHVDAFKGVLIQRVSVLDAALKASPLGEIEAELAAKFNPLPASEQAGDWTSVPTVTFTYDIEPGLVGVDPATAAAVREGYARTLAEAKAAAPPAERPKRRGRPPAVTEENIAKELGVRGIRVFLAPPPRFNLTREQAAQERLDHAAGKVVYWSELMQHAHILQE